MVLSYELTLDDILEATKHFQTPRGSFSDRSFKWTNRAASIGFWIIGIYAAVLTKQPTFQISIVLAVAILWCMPHIIWVAEGRPDRRRLFYAAPGNEILYGEREFEVSDSGFSIKGTRSITSYSWNALWDIKATDSHVLVFVSPVLVHAIPISAFKNPEHLEAFTSAFQRRLER